MSPSAEDELMVEFSRRFGGEPAGVWGAPGRVNLVGEHTDYNQGFVLPLAIDRLTRAAVRLRSDGLLRVASRQRAGDGVQRHPGDPAPTGADRWAAYVCGVAAVLGLSDGAEVLVDSEVPIGSGLSSSAALEISVGLAFADLTGLGLSRTDLALACQRAENEVVGAPTGVMDQMAALHGRAGHALFLDCRSLAVEPIPLDLDTAALRLLVVDTRAAHDLASGGYADRRRSGEEAARWLGLTAVRDADSTAVDTLPEPLRRRARHVVSENARVLRVVAALRAGDLAAVGPLLTASHVSLRDDFAVSVAELDETVRAALGAGALGARLTGGGFGGSVVALVPARTAAAVSAAVHGVFTERRWGTPVVFEVAPSDGARRLR